MARRGPALVPGRPPGAPADITPAPGALEKVRAFVNTRDIEQGTDELASPAALGAWLDQHGLGGPGGPDGGRITPAHLNLALELREALRGVLRSHAGASPGPHRAAVTPPDGAPAPPPEVAAALPSEVAEAPPFDGAAPPPADGQDPAADGQGPAGPEVATLRRIAAGLPVQLQISADGHPELAASEAAGPGPAALARLLIIAARAATLGTWERLKVCGADDCQWAFYDRSPTRSGCWCSMRICGSRAKSRAYRQRAAATPARSSRSARSAAPGA